MQIFNFMGGRATRSRINEILAFPRYTRAEMLAFTVPRIDSSQLTNWLRRGVLDLGAQASIGDSKQLMDLAGRLDANEKLGSHRRYTGGDALKCMILNVISQIGLPFSLSKEIIDIVLRRAVIALLEWPDQEAVICVSMDQNGNYLVKKLPSLDPGSDTAEWMVTIGIDRIIARFLRVATEHK